MMRNPVMVLLLAITIGAQAQNKRSDTLQVQTSAVCGMCKETIESEMIYEKGVQSVTLDLEANVVHVVYDTKKTDPDRIRKAITMLGYAADGTPGDEKAFSELPDCCQKEGCGKLPSEQQHH